MVETRIGVVRDEVKRVIRDYNSNNADTSIPNVEVEAISKYLNKIVVTFLNKHLIFCKKLEEDLFFIKGYKNVTLAQLFGKNLCINFYIKNSFKKVFFDGILVGDNLFEYSILDKKFIFNNIDKDKISNFIGIFRCELLIEALDWFFFELPDFLIENYSSFDFDFK